MNTDSEHLGVRGLKVAYGDFVLMRDVSFSIRRGDIFVIMGGSGCGKSTLLKVLVGLKSPAEGQVLYEGQSLWQADAGARRDMLRKTGMLYQSGALWSSLSLAENVALPLEQYTSLNLT